MGKTYTYNCLFITDITDFNLIKLRLNILLKYNLFKKQSFSWYFLSSGYLYNVKIKILNQSKNFHIQLKRTIKSLKYVSSCYTVSEKH